MKYWPPQATWVQKTSETRGPLGAVVSRELKSSEYTVYVSRGPKGEYVVLRYATRFQNGATLTENVIAKRDIDGEWRVWDYDVN